MQSFFDFLSMPEAYGTIIVVFGAIAAFFGFRRRGPKALPPGQGSVSESESVESADEQPISQLEQPEAVHSRMVRLRSRLARSGGLGQALLSVLSRDDLSAGDWEELEDTLLSADLGLEATDQIMEALRTQARVHGLGEQDAVRQVLREQLLEQVGRDVDRSLRVSSGVDGKPAAVLMVGVNGVGKTTSAGKIARILVAAGDSVLLGAADTFRAAAAEQLKTWGERVGVPVVSSDREKADPASVAFEAAQRGAEEGVDVVLIDTAGRLHNKSDLMQELGKIRRVTQRAAEVTETLLVLDATTGQNGMAQARVFAQVADVTGIVLTKLDGTAKGGIVVSVQKELGVPVKLVGLGEGPDDMAPFDPVAFVDSILAE